jgi:hypothetical protein
MTDTAVAAAFDIQCPAPETADTFCISDHTLEDLLRTAPAQGTVLDVGCSGWVLPRLAASVGREDLRHIGADLTPTPPPGVPPGVEYRPIPSDGAPICEAIADLTVSRHSLEHSTQPLGLFAALMQATKHGGLIYVEAPSELSCRPNSADDPRAHGFDCFWDDPTHVRPWPPAALYRLAIGFGATPLQCGRMTRWAIPCAAIVAQKTHADKNYRYVTLGTTPFGVEAAMQDVWNVSGTS